MLSGVTLTTSFSKCYGKKEKNTVSNFPVFEKNWALSSSINWPSNLVKTASCKCSVLPQKVRETFLVWGEKEQYLDVKTQTYLTSLFLLCFFNLLLCCPTTNISTDFNNQHLNWQHFNSYIMPKATDLFCHTVLSFVKSSMLVSFNPLNYKYWGNM